TLRDGGRGTVRPSCSTCSGPSKRSRTRGRSSVPRNSSVFVPLSTPAPTPAPTRPVYGCLSGPTAPQFRGAAARYRSAPRPRVRPTTRPWRPLMTLTATTQAPNALDLAAIKAKQQTAWSAGNYAVVGTTLQIVGETLCEAADVKADERVLDVAAGNGNATLAAARRFAMVTSTDYVPSLLNSARQRADAEGLTITFREADAENLGFPDNTFDVVLSTFGVMFTPDQERAASELLRVVRPGGRIGLANWTPAGFVGQIFATLGKHIPPAPGLKPPSRWGTPEWIRSEFGPRASDIQIANREYMFRY